MTGNDRTMRDEEEHVCGTCRHNEAEWGNGHLCGFHCGNEESEAYGLDTDYNDSCGEWEGKDE